MSAAEEQLVCVCCLNLHDIQGPLYSVSCNAKCSKCAKVFCAVCLAKYGEEPICRTCDGYSAYYACCERFKQSLSNKRMRLESSHPIPKRSVVFTPQARGEQTFDFVEKENVASALKNITALVNPEGSAVTIAFCSYRNENDKKTCDDLNEEIDGFFVEALRIIIASKTNMDSPTLLEFVKQKRRPRGLSQDEKEFLENFPSMFEFLENIPLFE